ncbi:Anaphase-promoting complex (APC) subunit 11 protein [Dioscorea alata]|uniref:Anaphase-promoting complex (APC) subunit 11 protein n=1 Tax=Dioscorea alata TaxID=55571 RepID=A0ACB7WER7_DIOAL|nr:Anaphase-promoting complex (APC) subunit 11 protein [Dioscorea alata]
MSAYYYPDFSFTCLGYVRDPGFRSQNNSSDDERTRVPLSIYPSRPEDMFSPWRLFEERVRTGPFGLSRFPSQPFSPIRILVYDNTNERVNPRLRQFIQDSPPHIQGEWHLPSSTQESGLTNEEFKKAMKKVRKQVYNPPYPRRKAWKRGLFNNKTSSNTTNNNSGDEEKDEGKTTCVICLESFEPNEQVLVTPCNHMFHHDCFVPWLKSQGKCPICRFSLCEGKDMALALSSNNSSAVNNDLNDLAADLAALIRAMEEAFNWVNLRRSV